MMRRSSRIQTKRLENTHDQKSKPSEYIVARESRTPFKTMKVLSPIGSTSQRISKQQKQSKIFPKQANSYGKRRSREHTRGKTNSHVNPDPGPSSSDEKAAKSKGRNVNEKQVKSKDDTSTIVGQPPKNELSIPLLIEEDSDDSILSDVANSLKIDRTIKNLSPRKFFHNKDPKTTRSGRSFSPYDFATYSALFGAICAKQNKPKVGDRAGSNEDKGRTEMVRNKRKRARRERKERPKASKRPRKQNARIRKMIMEPTEVAEPFSEVDCGTVVRNEVDVLPEKPQMNEFADELGDGLFSEKVPESFWSDFPYPRSPNIENHCLPLDFWDSDAGQSIPVDDREEDRYLKSSPKKLDPDEVAALAKVSLADAGKYEFKSAFKDVSSQIANFEDSCGEWKPSPAYGKFDLMEAESAEGKRFYRKRITDTGLIAWHKYNLASSTKYCPESDVPTPRPVIRVRSNQCRRADLLWRLNQTQPIPSVEDVFKGAVITHHPIPKLFKK